MRNLEIGAQFPDSKNVQRNLEIGMQFLDSKNAQCNLEIAHIPKLHGTNTLQNPQVKGRRGWYKREELGALAVVH